MTKALTEDFPEITGQAPINISDSKLMLDSLEGRYAELSILESNVHFFDLFETERREGNPRQISPHIKNLAITESAHERYFNGPSSSHQSLASFLRINPAAFWLNTCWSRPAQIQLL